MGVKDTAWGWANNGTTYSGNGPVGIFSGALMPSVLPSPPTSGRARRSSSIGSHNSPGAGSGRKRKSLFLEKDILDDDEESPPQAQAQASTSTSTSSEPRYVFK